GHGDLVKDADTTSTVTIGDADPDTVHTIYYPENQTYVWQTAQKVYKQQSYVLNDQSSQRSVSYVIAYGTLKTSTEEQTSIIDTGRYTDTTTKMGTNVYTYGFAEYSTGGTYTLYVTVNKMYDLIGHVTDVDYDHSLRADVGVLDVHTHKLVASQPIDITFMGNSGSIDVESVGSVVLAGKLSARGGTVTISSDGSITSD